MIEVVPSSEERTLVLLAHGTVTGEDYERVILPALAEKLLTCPKIRFLYQFSSDFTGYSPSALWDDAKLGMRFAHAFERIAVVTDLPWLASVVKFCSLFVSCPVKIFRNHHLVEARRWLSEAAP